MKTLQCKAVKTKGPKVAIQSLRKLYIINGVSSLVAHQLSVEGDYSLNPSGGENFSSIIDFGHTLILAQNRISYTTLILYKVTSYKATRL